MSSYSRERGLRSRDGRALGADERARLRRDAIVALYIQE